jgi:hypothetical protein
MGPPGLQIAVPRQKFSRFESISEATGALNKLDNYCVGMWGEGPPNHPPFTVYSFKDRMREEVEFKGKYGYHVDCTLREVTVAWAGWGFGEPCSPACGPGFFQNPRTTAMIEVANAACTRFWIEFVVGKFLWPKIEDSFELLDPSILAVATEQFGTEFAQAGHYS